MKKVIGFSLACAALLHASEASLEPLTIESTKLSDVSGEEVKSADLAEALGTKLPSINLIRRSGIANDVLLRGQKRDNINVTIDGTKIYGACPNRMDPPTSHVVTHNIESVEVIEGPYNVEEFGNLSGDIKVTMKEPTDKTEGEISVNVGSYGYKKVSGTLSGGNDRVQMMIVGSMEQSDQYEDGDGRTLAEQLSHKVADTKWHYKNPDIKAYEKQSFMGKINVAVTDNQTLKLSYTDNQSNDVLYPNSGMDADRDDSKIYNAEYVARNIGAYSKELNIQAYHSEVDHPMSTVKRKSSAMMVMTNHLTTDMDGVKIKNSFDAGDTAVKVGLDASNRNWDGNYLKDGVVTVTSINDADTENRALFAEAERAFGDLKLKAGARYDNTEISSAGTTSTNTYDTFSANLYGTYDVAASTTLFGGIGQSNRVPDPRELYFQDKTGAYIGTDGLDATTNREVDLGIEQKYSHGNVKLKGFYSLLSDYIYYNSTKALPNRFENIDASIYGFELSGAYYPIDALSLDFGMAYQRGEKDEALAGQTDKDLADIPPLKANAAINYYYSGENYARIEMQSAQGWSDYDSDNGEQNVRGYSVFNLKVSHDIDRSWNLTAGVDNVFDKAYAVSNTYKDLTLLSGGTGEVMLLNEPGRYFYLNATYSF